MTLLQVLIAVTIIASVIASASLPVIANVRGKKYDIVADSVEDFMQQVESLAGLEAGQQSVLFRGKVLNPSDKLEELGVSAGDVLNVMKGRRQRPVDSKDDSFVDGSFPNFGGAGLDGVDQEAYKKAMENLSPEDIQKSMKAMDNMLDSNFIDEYFGDEEKLEKARLQLLNNMDQYEQMMPGFKEQAKEIASDPGKWREAMLAAKEQFLKAKAQRDAMKQAGTFGVNSPESRYIFYLSKMCLFHLL